MFALDALATQLAVVSRSNDGIGGLIVIGVLVIGGIATAIIYSHKSKVEHLQCQLERAAKANASLFADAKATVDRLTSELSGSRQELEEAKKELEEAKKEHALKLAEERASQERAHITREEALRADLAGMLSKFQNDSACLPWVASWAARIQEIVDNKHIQWLVSPPHPAHKAAEHYRVARQQAREATRRASILENKVSLYEKLAPWLADYSDYSLEEIISGVREEAELAACYARESDPVQLMLTTEEYRRLSENERNQLALDRYWHPSRRKTAWVAGVQFERLIGYRYEASGYRVTYHGAVAGKQDLGIDLICEREGDVHIVQCKRLSVEKKIPVRENVVAQTYGAAIYYALQKSLDPRRVVPVIATTYTLSDMARKFAEFLQVSLREGLVFERYPCIKCNIGRDGERIYHLPFDQQYDATVIGDRPGEFYASTVAEAVRAGFRRAFKWSGS